MLARPVRLIGVDGRRMGYLFVLSRQAEGECAGSWVTDAVVPFEVRQPADV